MVHYLVIVVIIAIILIWQIQSYYANRKKLKIFQEIFPNKPDPFQLDYTEKETVSGIKSEYENQIMKEIIDSINKYLSNNKGAVSDYHLIKDIVDRNCDAAEEEINTQVPVPLYYGLMGTMFGILIGVGFLVFGGGLSVLLGNTTINSTGGIETLMGGVALAMISSICGIWLTTRGSTSVKDAKATVERNKNTFLSWIQSVLLPYLSSNTVNTLEKLTRNLAGFNTLFSSNTKELKDIFEYVNESYRNQAEVVKVINSLKIKDIANANILVYDKLKNCTEEIGRFSVYLQHVNEYIANVKNLNEKLDQNEARTKVIEEMAVFFKEEINQIEARKGTISKSVGTIDATLQDALSKLKENTDSEFNELNNAIVKQQDSLEKGLEEMSNNFTEAIKRQQNVLETKIETTSLIVDELKNLTAVKTSMDNLEKATTEQNRKIDTLSTAIKELAEIKAVGNTKTILPSWLKVSVISGVSILGIFFLLVAAWIVLKLLYNIQL